MIEKKEIELLKEFSKNLSIMIVEDEISLSNDYYNLAKYFFNDITVTNDAYSALEEYKKNSFDIIYTDINMPGMNGIELIREIKKIKKDQLFIVMSASDESNHLLDLLKLNISTFLLKPFKFNEFVYSTYDLIAILNQNKLRNDMSKNIELELKEVTIEKRKQEDMLIQQCKLAQAGEMVSMIAHQWRQPLSSITTQIATLKTRLELGLYDSHESKFEALSNDLYKSFNKIEKSAEFLSTTINNFRNFYKPDNDIVQFKIKDSLNSVLEILMLEQSDIDIERSYLLSENIMIKSHEGELQQVFMSILNNARDAILENNIEKPCIKILQTHDENYITIQIIDNGGGISESIIKSIFLPYFSTKKEKNGTGIGLHMAETIIEKHLDGIIKVENTQEPKGACFTITIPIEKEKKCIA